MMRRSLRTERLAAVLIGALLFATSGCAWYEQLKGPGFGYSETAGGNMRGKNSDAKPSGFFTDRRSEEIEKNLGGNF